MTYLILSLYYLAEMSVKDLQILHRQTITERPLTEVMSHAGLLLCLLYLARLSSGFLQSSKAFRFVNYQLPFGANQCVYVFLVPWI